MFRKTSLILLSLLVSLCCAFSEDLKVGDQVSAGYAKEVFDCEVVEVYGKLIGYKTRHAKPEKRFYVFREEQGITSKQSKLIKSDAEVYSDIALEAFLEAPHPNGEWYVGTVKEKYGKFIKVSLGEAGWSAVWVLSSVYQKTFYVEKELIFYDYRHRPIGKIEVGGVIKNREDKDIGKIYSNGRILDASGKLIGELQGNGSIENDGVMLFKTNIRFGNGVLYMDSSDKPLYVLRMKSASLYTVGRADIVHLLFDCEKLEGQMRIAAAVFLLLKDSL